MTCIKIRTWCNFFVFFFPLGGLKMLIGSLYFLWTKCFCPSQIHILTPLPAPPSDGGRTFGLDEVMGIGALWWNLSPDRKKRPQLPLFPMWGHCSRQPSVSQEEALTRNLISLHLDLGLPSLQNYEQYMSVVQATSAQYFVIAAWGDEGDMHDACLNADHQEAGPLQ